MKVVLDTNVFVSGVFFSGPPYQILNAWRHRKLDLIVSPEILDEYFRVGHELAATYPAVDLLPALELLTVNAKIVLSSPLKERVCTDSSDDKFIACALSSGARTICTGDKALLKVSGYRGIEIITPQQFVKHYLRADRIP